MNDNKLDPKIKEEPLERFKKMDLPVMQYRGLPVEKKEGFSFKVTISGCVGLIEGDGFKYEFTGTEDTFECNQDFKSCQCICIKSICQAIKLEILRLNQYGL